MALYQVRDGYVVHLENGKKLSPGAVFEPIQEVLDSQGWKIEPVKEEPKPETRAPEAPPQDRMIKKPPVKK